MIPAIADASGDLSAAWPTWVFLPLAAAALTWLAWAIATAPHTGPDTSRLDAWDGCAHGRHYYRMDLTREFYECANECGSRVNRTGVAL